MCVQKMGAPVAAIATTACAAALSSSSSSSPSAYFFPLLQSPRPLRDAFHYRKLGVIRRRNNLPLRCKAAAQDSSPQGGEVYRGVYGPWSVDSNDVREVILYRAGLVTASATFVVAASSAFLPDDFPIKALIQNSSDILYAVGAGGLGLSLLLIHIYISPIKRALQLLWAIGVIGSIAVALNLAAPANEQLVEFILHYPLGVWFIGPLFAALTGLAFKEGLCYGKLEAAALVFVIPVLLLGHLSGFMDEKLKLGFLATWMVLFTVFAARKFTQPLKDDIGDKSIFMFNALPEEEKKDLLLRIRELPQHDSSGE
eukprot:c23483_g1_i1 orf=135-1073(+)